VRKPGPLTAAFLTVLFDLLSFSMLIPDIQPRLESKGHPGALIGFCVAAYSLSQLVFGAPIGRWSDRVGRRAALLATSAVSVFAAASYALADNLGWLLFSRLLLGAAGANLGVAYAFVADVTTPEERAGAMGKLGMAFGIGFMFGPLIGATLVKAGGGTPYLLAAASTGFALVNLGFIWRYLPGIPPVPESGVTAGLSQAAKLLRALRTPGLGMLLVLFFVANFAFANLESTFFRFLMLNNEFSPEGVALPGAAILVFVGIVAAVVQGGLVGRLSRRFGEVALLRAGYILQAPALVLVPFLPLWIPFLAGALVLGFGSGIAQPSLSSLISQAAPKGMGGGTFGITQSLGALARSVAPLVGNTLLDIRLWLPYALAGVLMLVPLTLSFRLPRQADGNMPAGGTT
jgi:DHA1 family tetracycline resistance protein-like MFS transporter